MNVSFKRGRMSPNENEIEKVIRWQNSKPDSELYYPLQYKQLVRESTRVYERRYNIYDSVTGFEHNTNQSIILSSSLLREMLDGFGRKYFLNMFLATDCS